MPSRALLFTCIASLLAFPCTAKQPHLAATSEISDFQRDVELHPEALRAVSEAMIGSDLDSDPHVYATVLRSAAPGDQQRAAEILEILQRSMAKYKDYRAAIADGYQPFLPKTE